MARGDTATASLGIVDTLLQAIIAAFTANPIYALVIIGIGWAVGHIAHYQIFGY
jgi:hypothetical protein